MSTSQRGSAVRRSEITSRLASGDGRGGTSRTARRIAVTAFLLYAATGGGRIVGSDELAMLELSRALLRGRIAVPEGATLRGPDGREYTKNAAGQAVVALPLVAAAEAVAAAVEPSPPRRALLTRFAASFFNALVAAVLLGLFYATARGIGAAVGPALAATVMLGFTTPLWVYAKSFMAEPLQALGLLVALAGALRARAGDGRGVALAAVGALLAISVKLSMLPFALLCLLPLPMQRRAWLVPMIGLGLALAGHMAYNVARFGTPLETGYGAQASASAYTTPLWVGLYGLLFSSGKGLAWFAPAVWLVPAGWLALRSASSPSPRLVALSIATVAAVALPLYATFEHWAGDGSWGPRYLLPFLPLAFLGVALALGRGGRARRALAWALGVTGFLVQIGGVGIHFGAQMREAGDYPYTLPLDDPRFMSDSHFNPAFSPITGHWRMLRRNAREHLRGEAPRLETVGESGGGRVGVSEADQRRLLHALDFWWLYAQYAGVPAAPLYAGLLLLLAGAMVALRGVRVAASEERSPPLASAGRQVTLVEASGT
jgi:hypothetical protein